MNFMNLMNSFSFNKYILLLLVVLFYNNLFAQSFSDEKIKIHVQKEETAEELKVSLIIEKNDVTGFAKLEGLIPVGWTIKEPKLQSTAFHVNRGRFKIIWINTPPFYSFEVPLVFEKKGKVSENLAFTYSYLFDKEIYKLDILGISPDRSQSISTTSRDSLLNIEAKRKVRKQYSEINRELEPFNLKQKKNFTPKYIVDNNPISINKSGVVFKVQVAASKRRLSQRKLSNIYNGPRVIEEEFHNDGYYKYYIGYYSTYEDAQKEKLSCNVDDAFIVANKNGNIYNIVNAIKEQRRGKNNNLIYTVQFVALKNYNSNKEIREKLGISEIISMKYQDGLYKYSLGYFLTYRDASNFQKQMKFKQKTFIVPYKNGRKVTLREAKLLE